MIAHVLAQGRCSVGVAVFLWVGSARQASQGLKTHSALNFHPVNGGHVLASVPWWALARLVGFLVQDSGLRSLACPHRLFGCPFILIRYGGLLLAELFACFTMVGVCSPV